MIKKSTDTNTKINQTLELSDEDFKATIITTLQQAIIISLEINGTKTENCIKEAQVMEKNKMEIIELKNMITKNF